MMTTVLVALFLFSFPLLLLSLSLAGPGPCVAAEPRHSRSSMFMYSQRMASSGTASDVVKKRPWWVSTSKIESIPIFDHSTTENDPSVLKTIF